jgi:predicted nucleic acid-binding Zn ribbon protein
LLGVEGAVELAAVKKRWPDIVGAEAAGHCWPLSLQDGTLTVVADHNAWGSELRILSAHILRRLGSGGLRARSLAVQVGTGGRQGW